MSLFFMRHLWVIGQQLVLVLAFTFSAQAAVNDVLMKGRVMVLGDSITDAGMYVNYLTERLAHQHGKLPDLISIGLASETVSGLSEKAHPFPRPCVHERLGRALERIKPQVVIACYGMNDGIYHPLDDALMKAFQQGVNKLDEQCRAAGAVVIWLTPPPFDPLPVKGSLRSAGAEDYSYMAPFEGYAGVLESFARWQLTLPKKTAQVIDLNGPMTAYIAKRRVSEANFKFSGDGIHPSDQGHLLMADLVLTALGYPSVGEDLGKATTAIHADPLFEPIKKWRETRSNGWRDYVGYTRGKTVNRATVTDIEEKVSEMAKTINAGLAK